MKQIYIATLASLLISATVFAGNTPVAPKHGSFQSFQASREFDHNLLTWIIGLEASNSHFEVEKSTDGNTWKTIAMVLETGDSGTVKKYSYVDENNTDEVIYYRIRQIDIKGRSYYSSVRTVRRNMKAYRMASLGNRDAVICAVRLSEAANRNEWKGLVL